MKWQINRWLEQIKSSTLTKFEKQLSYTSVLKAQLNYPSPCITETEEKLQGIFCPVLHTLLNSYGASQKFLIPLRHSSSQYFGIELNDLYVMVGSAQI